MHKVMGFYGYTWEVHETVSETGFEIPLYRITGKVGDDSVKATKETPVLL